MKKKIIIPVLACACMLFSPVAAFAHSQTANLSEIRLATLTKNDVTKLLMQNINKVQSVKSMRIRGQFSIKLDAQVQSQGVVSGVFSKIKSTVNNTSGTFETAFQTPGSMYSKVAVDYYDGKQVKEPVSIMNYYIGDRQYIKLPLLEGKYSWVQKKAGNGIAVETIRNMPIFLQPSLLKGLSLIYKGNGEFNFSGAVSTSDAVKMLESVGVPKDVRTMFQTISGRITLSGKLTVDPKTFLTKNMNLTLSLVPTDSRVFKKMNVIQNVIVDGYNTTTVSLPTEVAAAQVVSLPSLPF